MGVTVYPGFAEAVITRPEVNEILLAVVAAKHNPHLDFSPDMDEAGEASDRVEARLQKLAVVLSRYVLEEVAQSLFEYANQERDRDRRHAILSASAIMRSKSAQLDT